ncbi:chemotaxis-specific protein-glutamate methyltransferase CheB [Paenibacillus gansuensis]|uniref:Protein-glutamate methylesterase/protein-glutamine glutaminase n=1 Tax=Paenibacillus gansuensis TaxID=306542 RepID=A0ABW5P7X4_9BACL
MKSCRVLVVDDSLVYRTAVARALEGMPSVEKVYLASDPFEARDQIEQWEPDVMVLDVEMPKMNGIVFLQKLLPQYPIPVIVMSTAPDYVFEALECGAVDFIAKPSIGNGQNMSSFLRELSLKIPSAFSAGVGRTSVASRNNGGNDGGDSRKSGLGEKGIYADGAPVLRASAAAGKAESAGSASSSNYKVIAIGASTGGTEAVLALLKDIPAQGSPGIVIVIHMPPGFTKSYAERLNNKTGLTVKEAVSGDVVKPGQVLVSPGGKHMMLSRQGNDLVVDCRVGRKVSGHCPSVDVLFDSVARSAGNSGIGVLLTGMGNDGALGLLHMRNAGARTLGQDEASSVVYGMPRVALEIGAVERQAGIMRMGAVIRTLVRGDIKS